MDIAKEEIFAPGRSLMPMKNCDSARNVCLVCTFLKFDTEEEVVKAANDTSMGLASYCFTKNVDRLWRLFENLEAGMIGLNTGKLPFSL
jgi:acyl-CoA reductase-like NAD-dependent aldehyde dehydrogenase